jgi:uncharacterized protein YjbJ (UPF0337 family)
MVKHTHKGVFGWIGTASKQRDQLEGKIQERYGKARDQVRSEVDSWLDRTA